MYSSNKNNLQGRGHALVFIRFWIVFCFCLTLFAFMGPGCGGSGGGDGGGTPVTPVSYTVSGTIAAAAVAVDSDVNDVNEAYASNDTFFQAQEIPSPVTLGGFVNTALSGESGGRSYASGDPDDFFRVSLNAGDEITLVVGEYDTADLELYLYGDTDPDNPTEAVVITGSFASLTVTDGGFYRVHVKSVSGASNYTLSVGAQGGVSILDAAVTDSPGWNLKVSDDFVPDEVILQLKDGIVLPDQQGVGKAISSLGLSMTSRSGTRPALMKIAGHQKQKVFETLGVQSPSSENSGSALTRGKMDTLRLIKALRNQPDVRWAEPNYLVRISEVPNDTYYPVQWNFPMVNLPNAWNITTGSSDVVVAVVDTGVLMQHPDLQGRLTADGYDFIRDVTWSKDGDGIDPNPDDPGDLKYKNYSSFHGTHCAGIVGAVSDNNRGVSGVSWTAKIMPVRVLGKDGMGTEYDVLQGVLYAAGLPNDSGTVPDQPADIINLSLGSDTYLLTAQNVYHQVRDQGVIVVAAAGNRETDHYDYPASYDGVLSVSAVDITGDLAWYSNYGNKIDVAAPGGDGTVDRNGDGYLDGVISTCGNDISGTVAYTYSLKQGTSMATPHVAGVIALMKAVNPDLTPDDVDFHLQNFDMTTDAGTPGWDPYFGYGIIDGYQAVQAARNGVAGAALKVTPPAFNFGYSESAIILTTEKTGDMFLPFHVDSVSDTADWLTVTPDVIDGQGLGTYIAQVDRTGLSNGFYSARITFTCTIDGQITSTLVRANLQVNTTGSIFPDSGYHYVLLVNADTLDTVMVDGISAVNGYYDFVFENVPDGGHYKIFAGTDRDFNRVINNYGECFGAYGTVDQPLEITVTENMADLNFKTELQVSFTATARDNQVLTNNRVEGLEVPLARMMNK